MEIADYLDSIEKMKSLVPEDKLTDFMANANKAIEAYKSINQERGKALTDLDQERISSEEAKKTMLNYQKLTKTLKDNGVDVNHIDKIAKTLNITATEKEELDILKRQNQELLQAKSDAEKQLFRYKAEETLKPKFDEVRKSFKVNDKNVEIKDRFINDLKDKLYDVDPSNETVYTERFNKVLQEAYSNQVATFKDLGIDPNSVSVPNSDPNRSHFTGNPGIIDRNQAFANVRAKAGSIDAVAEALSRITQSGGDINK